MSDGLDLSQVAFHNSPDVRAWPATAKITKLEFRPTGVHVEHTKNIGSGAWPNFRPAGWDGDLQYTLWLFEKINGAWHGAGGIQFWQTCDQNGGPPEEFAKNWFYAADRWAPMTGYQPKTGEIVGFMVSSGDARNNGNVSVKERSNIVAIPFPTSGGVYEDKGDPPDPPTDLLELLKTTRDEVILTKQQGAEVLAKVNALTAMVQALLDAGSHVALPDYAGTVNIKVLGKDTTGNILLKPKVGG